MLITNNLLEEHVNMLVHNTCESSLFDWCQNFSICFVELI